MNLTLSGAGGQPAIQLSDVSATGLLTLYCRAKESQSAQPILNDPYAVALTRQINTLTADSPDPMLRSLALGKVESKLATHIALRARRYDQYALDFLARHPDGLLVNLGCGMDTRFQRIDNKRLIFFDLDLPEMIRFKRQFISPSERYQFIGCSVLDLAWMDELAAYARRPALFLAEGLFMYLEQERVQELVVGLQRSFPGAELVCEVFQRRMLSKWMKALTRMKMQRQLKMGRDAEFKFGIADSREMESWHAGIEFLDDWSYFDSNHPKLGWMRWMRHIEWMRKVQWTAHYRLN